MWTRKMNEEHLQFYEDQTIRTVWDEEHEEWRMKHNGQKQDRKIIAKRILL